MFLHITISAVCNTDEVDLFFLLLVLEEHVLDEFCLSKRASELDMFPHIFHGENCLMVNDL